MAKIKDPKLIGVNKHNKISDPKREETLKRYLDWKYYYKSKSNKYITNVKRAFYNLPEIQEAIKVKEDLEDAAENVVVVAIGKGYGADRFYTTGLPEFTWNNKDTIFLIPATDKEPSKDEIMYEIDSELGEAIEDYEEYKDIIVEDRDKVRRILAKYDNWDELFTRYPIFRNLWEEDLDELYPGASDAWLKKNVDRREAAVLPKAGPSKTEKIVQAAIEDFNTILGKANLEKIHVIEPFDERWGDRKEDIFCRAVIASTSEYEKAMLLASQIVENLKRNPTFIRSTDLAAKYSDVVPTFDYVIVDFGKESLNRKISVPPYLGLKSDRNSSRRSAYMLDNNLSKISADLKVNSFQECIEFSVASLRTNEMYETLHNFLEYEMAMRLPEVGLNYKQILRENEKAVAVYNKLKEEGFSWNFFEDGGEW